jgi:hypothetical protein
MEKPVMKRKSGKSGGGGKKQVRPADDTVYEVPPPKVKATRRDQVMLKACALPWDALTRQEQLRGLREAEAFGEDFAYDWNDEPNTTSWHESIVKLASDSGVINDVEDDIWRLMPPDGDPRLTAFRLGCIRWRLNHPGKGGKLEKKPTKSTK